MKRVSCTNFYMWETDAGEPLRTSFDFNKLK